MEIFKEFKFDSAHCLPSAPVGHKCRRLHGHTYRVVVHVEGPVDKELGWIVDFADIKKAMKPLINQLDHHYLNDIEGLETPTAEALADWLWQRLIIPVPGLSKLVVFENESCGCIHTGPQSKLSPEPALIESKPSHLPTMQPASTT